jgi:hypothetical protein
MAISHKSEFLADLQHILTMTHVYHGAQSKMIRTRHFSRDTLSTVRVALS